MKKVKNLLIMLLVLAIAAAPALMAQEATGDAPDVAAAIALAEEVQTGVNTAWLLIAAFLVMFMQAGFAMVEGGFVRAKNNVNIMMKNVIDYVLGSLVFFFFGFGLMFGGGEDASFIGTSFFAGSGLEPPDLAFVLFQTVFAATAATIVSGAVAERMKFSAYFVYSIVLCAVVYPIIGHWSWAGLFGDSAGWLEKMGFYDFAGSTVVHGVGGFAGLAGAIVLGPRLGKYNKDGSANVIQGHSMPLATLGVFILWFGWFGFNPGSQAAIGSLADVEAVSLIAINTNLAAAAGAVSALVLTWLLFKKPDLSMTLNGALAGLVAITAPCAGVDPIPAIIIGLIGGIVVVVGVLTLDKLKIDDPVGAVSVHGFGGLWGTLSYGFFANDGSGLFTGGGLGQLGVQALGSLASMLTSFVVMFIIFNIVKATMGIRVSRAEELKGLDIGEHGQEAWGDFQIFNTK